MRIALGIEYDGSAFQGWQVQVDAPSVQATVEHALSRIANHPVHVTCSGRTDTGVHARCQVVHFDTTAERTPRAWILGSNSLLPDTVVVHHAQAVADDFHARFDARARRYRYTIANRPTRPAIGRPLLSWVREPIDHERMQEAAQVLVGTHDFSALRTVACQAKSPVRTIHHIRFARDGDLVHMDIQANAFLHHMVRNIVGSLLPIGRGEKDAAWLAGVLASRDRKQAGMTAEANGLVFVGPLYPRTCGLPEPLCLP